MAKRLIIMTNDELDNRTKKCKNDNTIKAEKKPIKHFIKFLPAMGVCEDQTDYWNYEEPILDRYLAKFCFGA